MTLEGLATLVDEMSQAQRHDSVTRGQGTLHRVRELEMKVDRALRSILRPDGPCFLDPTLAKLNPEQPRANSD